VEADDPQGPLLQDDEVLQGVAQGLLQND